MTGIAALVKRTLAATAGALVLLGLPLQAHAATTLGSTGAPNVNGCSPASWLQRTTGGSSPSYVVPGVGTITSWSYQAGAAGGTIKLKIVRPTSDPQQFTVVSETVAQTITINSLNTFTASLAVQQNDHLVLQVSSGGPGCFHPGAAGDVIAYRFGDDAPGVVSGFTDCGAAGCNQDNNLIDLSVVFVSIQRATSTTVACVPPSVRAGSASTCTATVSDTDTGTKVTPAGPVTFASNGSGAFGTSGTCTLAATSTTGIASCSVIYTPAAVGSGTHKITASFAATANNAASTGNTVLAVTAVPVPTLPKAGLVSNPKVPGMILWTLGLIAALGAAAVAGVRLRLR